MKTTPFDLFGALLALASIANSAPIFVANPSFEDPAIPAGSRTNTLIGWLDDGTDPSRRFVEHITGFNDGGNNHLEMPLGWEVWQDFPTVLYQPFTVYSLRVAVGNRLGVTKSSDGSRITMTNTFNTPNVSAYLVDDFTFTPPDTFRQVVLRHTTGASGDRIGTPLRIKLYGRHFDNVRLTSCGTFTGGDAGEGLDLQGDFVYAVNVGSNGAPGQIGNALFTADNVAGVTLTGASVIVDAWSNPDYGTTTNDNRLEQAMRSIRHNGAASGGKITVTLADLQPGRGYKLQLLFVEQCCDRVFDVRVSGTTIFDDFRPMDFGPVGTPLVIAHSFAPTGTTATIELDGLPVGATGNGDPMLSAFTLERSTVVNTVADSGAGSLRQALADAAATPGPDVIPFDPSVFNGETADTIFLTSAELAINDPDGVTIDASAISGGVTVSGNDARRVFNVGSGAKVTMKRLNLTNGSVGAGEFGGGILSSGTLTMTDCTISGNTAGASGGGVTSLGTLLMERCTLFGNTAPTGAGLHNQETATLTNCTMSGNTGGSAGGLLAYSGTLTLAHCTVSGNSASSGNGAGVVVQAPATLILSRTIVAGNTGAADIHKNGGTLTATGVNLIGVTDVTAAEFPAGLPNAQGNFVGTAATPLDARLAPLADYGGLTRTMLPRAGSAALDRIASTSLTTDQRGLPRVMWGKADIGAVEAGVMADCAWEVREIFRSPATALSTLALADALVADIAATTVTSTQPIINFADPDTNADGAGFFPGDAPFASNNLTPQGLANGDDDDFVTVARTFIKIWDDDDYTFGFSSDDGARLRIFGATFISSTRLNAANPANPAHSGDTLSFPGLASNASDTLGVCHLTPGIYPVEFLTWERNASASAEVFAANGAKTAVDSSFRLIGDTAYRPDKATLSPAGWSVDVIRNGATTLGAAVSQMTTLWCSTRPVTGLRFTSANDAPPGDPMTFKLEGTHGTPVAGPWVEIATGDTSLLITRLTAGPVATFANQVAYRSYRITFPDLRDDTAATAMQIAEVEFLDATGADVTAPGNPVIPTSANSPANEGAAQAIDNNTVTKYSNTDKRNAGFAITPAATIPANTVSASHATINFTDPQSGGGGHGGTQVEFPGNLAGDDNNFALGARATLTAPDDSDYTFCILADDSVRFRIKGSRGWTVAGGASPQALVDGFQTNGCCTDVFGQVFLTRGTYDVELIHNEIGGPAYVGLWAAQGRLSRFDAHTARFFSLVSPNDLGNPDRPTLDIVRQTGMPRRPLNDDFGNAFILTGPTASGSFCIDGATLESGEPATDDLETSVWWTWTAPTTGRVHVDASGSTLDGSNLYTVLSVHTGAVLNTLTPVHDDDGGPNLTSAVTFNATAGTVYRIRVGGDSGRTGTVRIRIGPPLANDSFATPTPLGTAATVIVTGSTEDATAQAGEPEHEDSASRSVWFTWTAPLTGEFVMDTSGSDFDTVLAVYTGTALNALTELASNDDFGRYRRTSRLVLSATVGVTYRIAIDGVRSGFGDRGHFVLTIIPVPTILAASVSNGLGGARTFNLRWRSEPGITYYIQQSSDLDTWAPVTTCTPSEGNETDVEITGIPAAIGRLYFRVARE